MAPYQTYCLKKLSDTIVFRVNHASNKAIQVKRYVETKVTIQVGTETPKSGMSEKAALFPVKFIEANLKDCKNGYV